MYNDDLYEYAESKNITVDFRSIPKNKSFSVRMDFGDFIVIDEKAMENSAEERTLAAHEIGHCETNAFYDYNSSLMLRSKAEEQATRWAVKKLINKNEMAALLRQGYEKWDLAEYFNVTEDFIEKAYRLYFEVGMPA